VGADPPDHARPFRVRVGGGFCGPMGEPPYAFVTREEALDFIRVWYPRDAHHRTRVDVVDVRDTPEVTHG
jgi:hypothetical protein